MGLAVGFTIFVMIYLLADRLIDVYDDKVRNLDIKHIIKPDEEPSGKRKRA